jgi:hypothetical protein
LDQVALKDADLEEFMALSRVWRSWEAGQRAHLRRSVIEVR